MIPTSLVPTILVLAPLPLQALLALWRAALEGAPELPIVQPPLLNAALPHAFFGPWVAAVSAEPQRALLRSRSSAPPRRATWPPSRPGGG